MATRDDALRVLQIGTSLREYGGIERYVRFAAESLRGRGHEVEIAATPGTPLAQLEGARAVPMHGKHDLEALGHYLRLFRSGRYDVAHVHFSPDFLVPALAARAAGVGCRVMTRHLVIRWRRAKARLYGRLWPFIIPVSEAAGQALLQSGISKGQMRQAKAGLPAPEPSAARLTLRRRMDLSDTCLNVGTFGRLTPEKGTDLAVRALAYVPNARLFVYGSGPEAEELVHLASLVGVATRVAFMGQVPDVADHLAAMDALVVPSRWEEPFPYSVLEAFALGVPVVASETGGLPEMVTPGAEGLLFKRESVSDLASALTRLAMDRPWTRMMGRAARARYEREFTLEKMGERLEGAYSSFLAASRR